MQSEQSVRHGPSLDLLVRAPTSKRRVLIISLLGFGLVVALVLLAAYLGYRGSDRIQDTAQALIREDVLQTGRGAALEARIVQDSQEMLDQLGWVLGLCFLLAVGTAALAVWSLIRAFTKLEWQTAELARVSWHVVDTHEKMARRFSHEMHDELGQALTGLRRMLGRARADDYDTLRPECMAIVDEVLQNVRKLSQGLRPVILDDFGLEAGLRWLCERFTQRTEIKVDYQSNCPVRMADPLETHLFRITQEALTNIARHSGATEAWVRLKVDGTNVRLEIADNGRGLRPKEDQRGISLGMVGMRARARQLGGELKIGNRKEGGVQIEVEAPLRMAEKDGEQEDSGFIG